MTIVKELDALHVNGEEYKFPANEGDMKYSDFSLVTKSGATITLDLFSEIEPSANFTVNAPSEIKEGQMYILRVVTGATPYTMTLGTGITNPYSELTLLTANTVHQFGFLAVDGNLELQPSVTQSGGGTWGSITGTLSDQTDLNTALNGKQDKATSGSSAPATTPSYIGQQYVDTTNNKLYVAKGTTSSSDWIEVGAGGGITIGTIAPSPASAGMLWYDTTSTIKALKGYDGSSWKIIGPEIVPITQADYDLLSLDEQNNGKFYLIIDSQGQVVVAWSDITGKPSDLTAAQIQTGSSTTAGMVSPSVISASMPRLSTQTGNLSELKFWIGTTAAYQQLDSYDNNTVYICKQVIS